MKTLNADIKNHDFKKIYLLYGDEEYLKKNYKNSLKKAMIGEDTMNYTYYEGKKIDVDNFISTADTMPFFTDMKCILIEDSGWFKTSNDKIASYIVDMPDTTHIIFVETEIDKRNKLYKKIKDIGYICELIHPSADELTKWAAGIIIRAGKKITEYNMELFLSYTGNDMENVRNEIEKLLSYIGDKEIIDGRDIDMITTVTISNRIFDMVRAIIARKTHEAMSLYDDLLTLKEAPMKILFMIARQFNQLLQVKDLSSSGADKTMIAKSMKLQPFIVAKLITQARGFDRNALLSYVRQCVELEEDVKTGNMQDRLAVEMIITGEY